MKGKSSRQQTSRFEAFGERFSEIQKQNLIELKENPFHLVAQQAALSLVAKASGQTPEVLELNQAILDASFAGVSELKSHTGLIINSLLTLNKLTFMLNPELK